MDEKCASPVDETSCACSWVCQPPSTWEQVRQYGQQIKARIGNAALNAVSDPLTQYGAWEFPHFAASQRGNTIITSVIGYVPQRDDVVDDPNYLKPFLDTAAARVDALLADG